MTLFFCISLGFSDPGPLLDPNLLPVGSPLACSRSRLDRCAISHYQPYTFLPRWRLYAESTNMCGCCTRIGTQCESGCPGAEAPNPPNRCCPHIAAALTSPMPSNRCCPHIAEASRSPKPPNRCRPQIAAALTLLLPPNRCCRQIAAALKSLLPPNHSFPQIAAMWGRQ